MVVQLNATDPSREQVVTTTHDALGRTTSEKTESPPEGGGDSYRAVFRSGTTSYTD
jgi:hypothetical protein